MVSDRGQIHTLEAFIAALLLIGALLFASQATAVTPLSASTANQHIENQQQTVANDVLAITAADGSLQDALVHWNTSSDEGHFNGSHPGLQHYTGIPPNDTPLYPALNQAFDAGVHAYNIELRTADEEGEFDTTPMIYMGTPSDNAVTARTTVTLNENDTTPENKTLAELADSNDFWAEPHPDANGSTYTLVEVRMTVWRM